MATKFEYSKSSEKKSRKTDGHCGLYWCYMQSKVMLYAKNQGPNLKG